MQGGQGEVKHWAFNDPPKRSGEYVDAPPSPEEFPIPLRLKQTVRCGHGDLTTTSWGQYRLKHADLLTLAVPLR